MTSDEVVIQLSQDEALVLLEWLAKGNVARNENTPENRVLWDLEAMLEPQVNVLMSSAYDIELDAARKRLVALYCAAAAKEPKSTEDHTAW